jgi:prolyl-tRNA synthetase
MKTTQYFLPTLKQAPKDADTISAKLMIRAGLIRKVASGIYEWLPLGHRVLRKVEQIVRQEMDCIGGQEIWMPVIQPRSIWEETGRWNVYGDQLLRMKDRKGSDFCFAPTAEEVITDLIRKEVRSHKQLSFLLYQFAIKFRDELRPRFGVMRAREFYMKDGYSFHADDKDASLWYEKIISAYNKICQRCGFDYKMVEAASGAIGGSYSHEFMILAKNGENEIAFCDCGYAANTEKAETAEPESEKGDPSKFKKPQNIKTPATYTVEDTSKFLKVPQEKFIKTMFYIADENPVIALIRGDHQLNENKLVSALKCQKIEKADDKTYQKIAGCNVGFAGPVGIKAKAKKIFPQFKVVADFAIKNIVNGVSGANKKDYHTININAGTDFEPDSYFDLKTAQKGDLCPKCRKPLNFTRGIEVSHAFKLGTKYSKAMKAYFLDENQKSKPVIMGCYGVGISRIIAAAIEQSHDERGIIWQKNLAPFDFTLITIENDENIIRTAQQIYDQIQKTGMSVLWDDRNIRAGEKFNDADLIGLPYRIIISKRTLAKNEAEFKERKSDKTINWKIKNITANLKSLNA